MSLQGSVPCVDVLFAVIPVSRESCNSIRIQAGAIGVALESIKRGGLGAHGEGEAANLNRLGEEDIDRVREANSPACIDGCGIGLDLCGRAGVVPGSYAYHELCCRGQPRASGRDVQAAGNH